MSGLGEIEFYIREDSDSTAQTPYTNSPTAAVIIHPTDQRTVYEFTKVLNSRGSNHLIHILYHKAMFIILKGEIDEASITIGILRNQCIFF